jgi:hypothetical protein
MPEVKAERAGAAQINRCSNLPRGAVTAAAAALDPAPTAVIAGQPAGGLAAAKRLVRSALDRPKCEEPAEERRSFEAPVRDDPEAVAAMRAALARSPV